MLRSVKGYGTEENPDTLTRPKLLRDTHNGQDGIRRAGVFREAKELCPKAHYCGPVKPDNDRDHSSDNINHANRAKQVISSDVTNGQN